MLQLDLYREGNLILKLTRQFSETIFNRIALKTLRMWNANEESRQLFLWEVVKGGKRHQPMEFVVPLTILSR